MKLTHCRMQIMNPTEELQDLYRDRQSIKHWNSEDKKNQMSMLKSKVLLFYPTICDHITWLVF